MKTGRQVRGEEHPKAKLSDEDVRLMRALREEGLTYQAIADKFEVPLSTARNIVNYATRRSA